jgi:hypothetical protein
MGVTSLLETDVVDSFTKGVAPSGREASGELPSGGAMLPFSLAAGETATWRAVVTGASAALPNAAAIDQRLAAGRAAWEQRLGAVEFTVPAEAKWVVDSVRSNLAYILINADGPAIHPGSRSYSRSWIRDGCLTSSALLSLGHAEEAVKFIDWYSGYLFESGKVPCVVDARGPDPVPENDSHGEYIFAVMNAYRFTHDRSILERHWASVQKAAGYIDQLRQERRTAAFDDANATRQEPGKPAVSVRAFRGLMPESISHEGYSAKPMHSYWDDFFTLRGLKDAVAIAKVLGDVEAEKRLTGWRDEFASDFAASVRLTMKAHGITYVPGCVELGDFDSTSTTIGVWPCAAEDVLPEGALKATFDRYWTFSQDRASGKQGWDAFTPYELRHIGAYVRLGERERAMGVLEFMHEHQRPQAWNHWAEVVFRERNSPRFIGDMPHTWCGSDFVNSVRAMFVYEDEKTEGLVVFAGVPRGWVESKSGVGFGKMPTWYGTLTGLMKGDAGRMVVELAGDVAPPGGIAVRPPRGGAKSVMVNGVVGTLDGAGGVVVKRLPAVVEFEYGE